MTETLPQLDPISEREVELEQTALLFRNAGIGQAVTAVNAGILVFILGGLHPPSWALAWWGVMLAIAAGRYGLALRFSAAGAAKIEAIERWRKLAVAGAFIGGLAWAMGSMAMMLADPVSTRLFVGLVSAGMVAGAIPLLSSVLIAFRAYMVPVVLAVGLTALADVHGWNDWMLAVVTMVFATAMLKASRNFHDSLDRSLRLTQATKGMVVRLENSEQLFRTLAESTNTAIFTYRDHFEYVNPAGERLCGYSLEEFRQMPFWSVLHPDDRARAKQRGEERIGGNREHSHEEYRILTKHGQVRWIEFHGALVMLDGKPTGLGSAFDITDRKQAEASLIESELKFHTMVDWTYDWEYWIGEDGRFQYMTPSSEQVTGYRPDEFEVYPGLIEAIVHPDDRAIWERHTNQHLPDHASREAAELVFRIMRKHGEIRWVSHSCRAVFDRAGQYQGRRVTVRDITDSKLAEDEIRRLAYFDPLTHLPNRRLLMDRLGQALSVCGRSQEFGALMILDLDHFKGLNDTQGHDVGDRLLVEVAKRLLSAVRKEDTVARLGGDEYVVMLERLGRSESAAAQQAEAVAEKIRAALGLPYVLGGTEAEYRSTSSIGLTLFHGEESASTEILLKQADVALYQAKDAGRNAIRFFNPQMQAVIESRIALEGALRRGLERDEFRLYYQPQVDSDGRLIGAEALVRWQSPEQGLVSPATFIPLAEETGLILQIGEWVMGCACRQLAAWADDPVKRHLQIAVNVSARQFLQPDFVEQVSRVLVETGASPNRLKLELTESIVLDNVELVIGRMQQLDSLGVEFSLDDFGTGYSSLSYLKRLPLDQIKIDQSFVRDVTLDPNDAAIVRAILAMSRSLGLQVIAEGVETEAQRDFLVENGCSAFQGYLFGKPMPVGEWETALENAARGVA